ncbi:MAG: hypothetical protein GY732_19780 [Gammaproteobacteria bacterium]|nr:hypothetical protein [Gammaproteobacteria bacterium]
MIEVLIALALLSLGLAGLASMHLGSLQYVHSAHYRSLASTIALDFEERLWLELADNELATCPGTGLGEGSTTATLIADWTRTAVGDEDWAWSTTDLVRIPNLTVEIGTAVTTTSCTEIPVTLTWNENRFEELESTSEQFSYTVRILCRPGSAGGESGS